MMIFLPVPKNLENGNTDTKKRALIAVAVIGGVLGMLLLGYFICRRGSKGSYFFFLTLFSLSYEEKNKIINFTKLLKQRMI